MKNNLKLLAEKLRLGRIPITTLLFIILLFIFIALSVIFALRLKTGIMPDENFHFALSKLFSTTWGIPPDSPETFRYGNITHKPFIYYWVNGRAINALELFVSPLGDWKLLVFLRLINVIYSILTVIFCYLLTKEMIESRWWQLLVVFLLTNTLMFVFLSGGLNYDNLANLCSFAGIYFLFRVFARSSFYLDSLAWIGCIFTGTLVKITILPLAVIIFFVWILYIVKNYRSINFHFTFDWKTISLLTIFIILVSFNFSIYGVNILRYKTISPACAKVLTKEQCDLNPVVRRDNRVKLPEKLTYLDIIRGGNPDPVEWFYDYWIPSMLTKIYGVQGHISYYPDLIITFYRLFITWALFVIVKYWKKPSFAIGSLFIIFSFYAIVLLRTNYEGELITGFIHPAIQGRYIFPVIGIFYIIVVYYLACIPNSIVRRATVGFTLFLFLWGSPLLSRFIYSPIILPRMVISPEQPVGEISGGREVYQEFNSQCYGTINQIQLIFSDYNRINTHPVTFRLTNITDDRVITEQTIPGESIVNGAWRSFNIPPLSNSKDTTYRIAIISPASVSGNAITLFSSGSDVYPEGHALVNRIPTGNDLSFRYLCMQPALIDWFY